MLKLKRIRLRLIKDKEECRKMIDAYNNVSERAETDHTEVKQVQSVLREFEKDGLWGENRGTMLITNEEDEIIGNISFTKCSEFELEMGYRLFHRENRGKGYVSEALPYFSAYLFETKPINRLRLQTASDNVGSQRVAEKSGYKQEGVLRKAYFYRGKICDVVIYGLLREECTPFKSE
jgi:[ribosomal protein S5]-alanine N-acetyltransferase